MKNEEASNKTTSKLLDIARKHFTEYGYFDVALEKIAEEGNVTRGGIYHHFKNKQGLFTAVLECVQKDVSMQIERMAMASDDPWQQLQFRLDGQATYAEEYAPYLPVEQRNLDTSDKSNVSINEYEEDIWITTAKIAAKYLDYTSYPSGYCLFDTFCPSDETDEVLENALSWTEFVKP